MWFLSRNNEETPELIYASYTDKGDRSETNQDSLLTINREDFAVFCVADGMGGHSKGDFASGEVVNSIKSHADLILSPYKGSPTELFDGFEKAIEEANKTIFLRYNRNSICGSTVAVIVFYKDKFCIISAGDSRVYRKDGREMLQVTRDDIWENQISPVVNADNNGKLLKAVGTSDNLICNRFAGTVKKGDLFFLCCDGIYKVVGEDYIRRIPAAFRNIKDNRDAEKALSIIHEMVSQKGSPDDNTGIIIKVTKHGNGLIQGNKKGCKTLIIQLLFLAIVLFIGIFIGWYIKYE